jgi:hypothetical protein
MQPTDNRSKPLLPKHHNWSWYIQWMIWDGLEGDSIVQDGMQQAGFCAVGHWKFSWHHLTVGPLSMQPTDNRSKPLLPNHHN